MADADLQLQAITDGLVRHFRDVAATRMADVPIVNPHVDVEAVGFERVPQGLLGVLITPWFINLVLLPLEGDDWRDQKIGSEIVQSFASGTYVFQVAGDDSIGAYQTCSLMSPILELADHAAAVALARSALDALHDENQRDTTSDTRATEIARRWHDADETPNVEAEQCEPEKPKEPAQLSRRAFLGGTLFSADQATE